MRMQHIAATNEIKDLLSVVSVGEFPSVVVCIQLYMSFATATARKMQRVVAQPMLNCAGHAVRRLQSLCTGRYDALYVQRYRQTTGKCEF